MLNRLKQIYQNGGYNQLVNKDPGKVFSMFLDIIFHCPLNPTKEISYSETYNYHLITQLYKN